MLTGAPPSPTRLFTPILLRVSLLCRCAPCQLSPCAQRNCPRTLWPHGGNMRKLSVLSSMMPRPPRH